MDKQNWETIVKAQPLENSHWKLWIRDLPGKENSGADAPSRWPDEDENFIIAYTVKIENRYDASINIVLSEVQTPELPCGYEADSELETVREMGIVAINEYK